MDRTILIIIPTRQIFIVTTTRMCSHETTCLLGVLFTSSAKKSPQRDYYSDCYGNYLLLPLVGRFFSN